MPRKNEDKTLDDINASIDKYVKLWGADEPVGAGSPAGPDDDLPPLPQAPSPMKLKAPAWEEIMKKAQEAHRAKADAVSRDIPLPAPEALPEEMHTKIVPVPVPPGAMADALKGPENNTPAANALDPVAIAAEQKNQAAAAPVEWDQSLKNDLQSLEQNNVAAPAQVEPAGMPPAPVPQEPGEAPPEAEADHQRQPMTPEYRQALKDAFGEAEQKNKMMRKTENWDSLLKKIQTANFMAQGTRVGENLLSQMGPPGWQWAPDKAKYEALKDSATAPLELAQARQKMEAQGAQTDSVRLKSSQEAALADPYSTVSERVRKSVKSMLQDSLSPEQEKAIDLMSAKDIKEFVLSPEISLAKLQAMKDVAEKRKAGMKPGNEEQRQAWLDSIVDSGRYTEGLTALGGGSLKEGVEKFRRLDMKSGQDLQNAWEADKSRKTQIEAAREGRTETRANTVEDKTEEQVERLSKLLPPDYKDFGRKYDQILAIAKSGKGDIPGVGIVDSNLPNWMQSRAGIELQKRAKQLSLAYQHLITGAGASDRERAALEQATIDMGNERSFMAGLESLRELYDSKVGQIRAGFKPEVLSRYDAGISREFGHEPQEAPQKVPDKKKGHGKVTKETKSFRQYADGFIERK